MSSYRQFNVSTINDGNPMGEILDMIFNKAPALMRAGGGALPQDHIHAGRALDERLKVRIVDLYLQKRALMEIADEVGVSKASVVKFTKHLRQKEESNA